MAWLGWAIFAGVMGLGALVSFFAAVSPDMFAGTDFPTGGEAWVNVVVGGLIASGASAKAQSEKKKEKD